MRRAEVGLRRDFTLSYDVAMSWRPTQERRGFEDIYIYIPKVIIAAT
jgi:hypothetical protein